MYTYKFKTLFSFAKVSTQTSLAILGSAVFLMKNNVPHSLKSTYGHNGLQFIV
jgi:hypothetical protein